MPKSAEEVAGELQRTACPHGDQREGTMCAQTGCEICVADALTSFALQERNKWHKAGYEEGCRKVQKEAREVVQKKVARRLTSFPNRSLLIDDCRA